MNCGCLTEAEHDQRGCEAEAEEAEADREFWAGLREVVEEPKEPPCP